MKKNKNGFTLAELLIVVAIIAVLVAIGIPVMISQLEKSREATDLANVRSAYAAVMTAAMVEDKEATFNGVTIWNGDAYQADVPLKQTQAGWQMKKESLNIGGVKYTDTDKWFDSPEPGSVCSVMYESASGTGSDDMEVHIYWNGSYYDYLSNLTGGVPAAFAKTKSRVLNSAYGNRGVLATVFNSIVDEKTKKDIQTFAVVKDADQDDTYNVIYSSFATTDNKLRGVQIPAVLYDGRTEKYTVGYATVNKASDGNYNIITLGPNGEYVGNVNNDGYNEYKSTSLIKDGTTYSSQAAAQRAYQDMVDKLVKDHPEYAKYLPAE